MTEPYPYAPEWDELLSMADAIRMKLLGLRWASNHAPLNDRQVFLCWADPEDISEYPAVGIMAAAGSYGGDSEQSLSSGPEEASRFPRQGDGHVLMEDSQFVADIDVIVWGTDPIMRSVLTRAVREALQGRVGGVDGKSQYGIDLPCPRYFGGYSSCHVSPQKVRTDDSAEDAKRRHRKSVISIRCTLPLYHVEGAQDLLPRVVLQSAGDAPL